MQAPTSLSRHSSVKPSTSIDSQSIYNIQTTNKCNSDYNMKPESSITNFNSFHNNTLNNDNNFFFFFCMRAGAACVGLYGFTVKTVQSHRCLGENALRINGPRRPNYVGLHAHHVYRLNSPPVYLMRVSPEPFITLLQAGSRSSILAC